MNCHKLNAMKNQLAVIFCLVSTILFSQAPIKWGVDQNKYVPVGLKSGEKAPNFKALDHNGDQIDLQKMLTKGKVVLLFYRGEWCPVCNRYLSNFQDSIQYILDKGTSVIAVTPETKDNAAMSIKKTGMTFSVVSDIDEEIMNKYDVLFSVTESYQNKINNLFSTDIATNNGHNEAKLPVPATYIINQNGEIGKVFFDYNYKNRATVGEILKAL